MPGHVYYASLNRKLIRRLGNVIVKKTGEPPNEHDAIVVDGTTISINGGLFPMANTYNPGDEIIVTNTGRTAAPRYSALHAKPK